jgi:hypothetical protein
MTNEKELYVFLMYTNEHCHDMFLNIEIKVHVNNETEEFDVVQNNNLIIEK